MKPIEYYQANPNLCDTDSFQEKLSAYMQEMSRLLAEFKHDLFTEYGVQDHPKRDQAYAIAYDLAGGNGLEIVQCYFEQIVELIQD